MILHPDKHPMYASLQRNVDDEQQVPEFFWLFWNKHGMECEKHKRKPEKVSTGL